MRKELFEPTLSDRQGWEKWIEDGSKDARIRARELAADYIGNHKSSGLTPTQQKDILNSIDGIIENP
jgi:trimethylamine:corrinoid methyltransferase-like protein